MYALLADATIGSKADVLTGLELFCRGNWRDSNMNCIALLFRHDRFADTEIVHELSLDCGAGETIPGYCVKVKILVGWGYSPSLLTVTAPVTLPGLFLDLRLAAQIKDQPINVVYLRLQVDNIRCRGGGDLLGDLHAEGVAGQAAPPGKLLRRRYPVGGALACLRPLGADPLAQCEALCVMSPIGRGRWLELRGPVQAPFLQRAGAPAAGEERQKQDGCASAAKASGAVKHHSPHDRHNQILHEKHITSLS